MERDDWRNLGLADVGEKAAKSTADRADGSRRAS